MQTLVVFLAVLHPAAPPEGVREPWASKGHSRDVAGRHVEDATAARHQYGVTQGGTMDGTNCRSPVGGGFAIWEQSWESNRAVRLENVGTTDVIAYEPKLIQLVAERYGAPLERVAERWRPFRTWVSVLMRASA